MIFAVSADSTRQRCRRYELFECGDLSALQICKPSVQVAGSCCQEHLRALPPLPVPGPVQNLCLPVRPLRLLFHFQPDRQYLVEYSVSGISGPRRARVSPVKMAA